MKTRAKQDADASRALELVEGKRYGTLGIYRCCFVVEAVPFLSTENVRDAILEAVRGERTGGEIRYLFDDGSGNYPMLNEAAVRRKLGL